jgi:phosphoglycolate phosphatase-like HAD superfamily hydrolase
MKPLIFEIESLDALFAVIADIEASHKCKIKAVSFDIDGTLMNVTTVCMVLAESAVEVLGEKGCALRRETGQKGAYDRAREMVGRVRFGRWEDQVKIFQPALAEGKIMTREEGESIVERYGENFHRAVITNRFKDSLFPEARDVLAELRSKGTILLIHSGRYTNLSKPQLASVGFYTEEEGGFLFNICGGDLGNKDAQIKHNLAVAGIINQSQLIVVGDTQDDLDAAIHNGAHPVRIKHRLQ